MAASRNAGLRPIRLISRDAGTVISITSRNWKPYGTGDSQRLGVSEAPTLAAMATDMAAVVRLMDCARKYRYVAKGSFEVIGFRPVACRLEVLCQFSRCADGNTGCFSRKLFERFF